jgi:hypothetical protein
LCTAALAPLAQVALPRAAFAQGYPSRNITIAPFAAGVE